ncbi:MAG: EVE domain-containing protein [Halobacteriovoraceae bacterium]|nr:EVE domain-containing protein [Halobacteriovoraceae bacterium]MBT5096085.1 EVE domain-containing protein [Halobacteriovoraceae bacterium]
MKTEPETFSIDDLKAVKSEPWDGVRNYQARNFMRDDMKKGDKVLFYHSNCKVPGIVGIAEVSKEAYPDHTAFDKKSKYFDPKSKKESPRWMMVEVKFKKKFKETISLNFLKDVSGLDDMVLLRKGNRLSIMPVSEKEFKIITNL